MSDLMGFQIFDLFEKRMPIFEYQIPKLTNYICANLNANYSPNRGYYYRAYNYVSKLKIVTNRKKKKGIGPLSAKKGEMICEDRLVNFYDDATHLDCRGGVYFF